MNIWRKIEEEDDPSGKSQRQKEERRPGGPAVRDSTGFSSGCQGATGRYQEAVGGAQGHEAGVEAQRQKGDVHGEWKAARNCSR